MSTQQLAFGLWMGLTVIIAYYPCIIYLCHHIPNRQSCPPSIVICLPLCIALGILNPHITNSIYEHRTSITERNRGIRKVVQCRERDTTYKRDLAKRIELIK
jgi:hypothetical protein